MEPSSAPAQPGSHPQSRRIFSVIDSLWVGGTERSLLELVPELTDRGIHTTIVCLRRRRRGVYDEAIARGHDVVVLERTGLVGQVIELRRLIRQQRPQLVHCALFRASLVSRLATRGLGVPLLGSLVNTPYVKARFADPQVTAWKLRLVQWLDRHTARYTDHFHAVSEAAKQHAVEALRVPAQRISVAPRTRDLSRLGKNTPARRAEVRQRLGIALDATVLLSVGREDYQKNQIELIEALPAVLADLPDALLLIAGREGSSSKLLRQRAGELGVTAHVRHLGHRSDVPDLMVACDLFCFPSLWEGYPGALLEALVLGCRIMCRDIPQCREVLALVGDPADAEAALGRLDGSTLIARLADPRPGRQPRQLREADSQMTLAGLIDQRSP
jgi:glycosyltransferase involved in cell wall biosynthesis